MQSVGNVAGSSSTSKPTSTGGTAKLRQILPNSSAPAVGKGGSAGTAGSSNHSVKKSRDNPAHDAPQAPASKKKRATVQAACQICRKRKVKCDGVRPKCAPCASSGSECEYSVPEGLSQRDAERQKTEDLRHILTLLRQTRAPESAEILRQVREAESLDDAVARISDAYVLLRRGPPEPPASTGTASSATLSAGTTALATKSKPAAGPVSSWVATVLQSPTHMTSSGPNEATFAAANDWTSSYRGGQWSSGGRDSIRFDRRIMSPLDKPDHIFESMFERTFRDGEGSGTEPRILDLPMTTILPVNRWTTVSHDNRHLTHLLTLFYTWDNTFIRLLDRELFQEDMRNADPDCPTPPGPDEVFCSSFLVNALLAVSCLYSTQDIVYDVPFEHNTRGRRFADEAKRLLPMERTRPSLTLMQGVALLWLWEGSVGDGVVASGYQEEMYPIYSTLGLDQYRAPEPLPEPDSRQGRALQAVSHIVWGWYYLNAKIGINFNTRVRVPRPLVPKFFELSRISYLAKYESPCYHWCAYPVNFRYHASHFREVLVAESTFAEIVCDVMDAAGVDGDATAATLLRYEAIYERLLRWKMTLPDHLQPNNSILPSVLSLNATYDMAVIKLLTPLCCARFMNERFADSTPSTLKISAAFSLIGNIWTFRTLYTLKHEYWLMQSCFTAATAVLQDLEKGSTVDVFVRACQGLHEMGEFLKLANKFLLIIKNLVTEWKVRIPDLGRTVRAKYFSALKSRKTTPYINGTHLLFTNDEGVIDMVVGGAIANMHFDDDGGVD